MPTPLRFAFLLQEETDGSLTPFAWKRGPMQGRLDSNVGWVKFPAGQGRKSKASADASAGVQKGSRPARALLVMLLRNFSPDCPTTGFQLASGAGSLGTALGDALAKMDQESNGWAIDIFYDENDSERNEDAPLHDHWLKFTGSNGSHSVSLQPAMRQSSVEFHIQKLGLTNSRKALAQEYTYLADCLEGKATAAVEVTNMQVMIRHGDMAPLLPIDEAGPVRTGSKCQFHITLNRPGWLVLVWIDAAGEAFPLWPWVEYDWASQPVAAEPGLRLVWPPEKECAINPPPGVETIYVFPLASAPSLEILNAVKALFQNRPWHPLPEPPAHPGAFRSAVLAAPVSMPYPSIITALSKGPGDQSPARQPADPAEPRHDFLRKALRGLPPGILSPPHALSFGHQGFPIS